MAGDDDAVALASVGSSLPVRPFRFLGRDEHVASMVATLSLGESFRCLVLGGPGIGKTTLTRQVSTAEMVVSLFGQRRWFVELDGVQDVEGFNRSFVRAAGLPATATFSMALARIQTGDGLLLLDNLETPWEGDTLAVERQLTLISESPKLSVFASLRGDQVPDGCKWSKLVELTPLSPSESRDLFLQIATRVSPDDPFLRRLLGALGGVPLAIELVALQATDKVEELWSEWHSDGVRLARRFGVPESRITSLERSIELSMNSRRMDEDAKRLIRLLGRLPAGIAPIDRRSLLGDGSDRSARQLRSVGLAYQRESRLDLLPPIREYVRRHHALAQGDNAVWRDHYLGLASQLGKQIDNRAGGSSLTRLAPELPNLDAAMRAALEANLLEKTASALAGFERIMATSGAGSPDIIKQLAAACRSVDDLRGEAVYEMAFGKIVMVRSDKITALDAFERALSLYQQIEDRLGEAEATQCIGDVAFRLARYDIARPQYESALKTYREFNHDRGIAACLTRIGEIAFRLSDLDVAAEIIKEANRFYNKIDFLSGEAGGAMYLGQIAMVRGNKVEADAFYREALGGYEQSGDVQGQANSIRLLAQLEKELGDDSIANDQYARAIVLYRQTGDVLGEAECILSIGEIAGSLGAPDYDVHYAEALRLFEQINDRQGIANCTLRIGEAAEAREDFERAKQCYEFALPLYRDIGDVLGQILCNASLGNDAKRAGDVKDATQFYRQYLALAQKVQNPVTIGKAHEKLASVTEGAERDEHVHAARAAWESIGRNDLVEGLTVPDE